MLVPVLGQLLRRPCPAQDRPEDGPPGDAGDVAEDLRQLQVHLLQGFLHVLHVLAGMADQRGPLPQVGPQLAGLLVGPKGRSQQADAMQPIDPLAVAAVRLGTPAQLAGVAGIDQEHLEALRLEQLIQSDPVDARRFQGDGVDLMLMQEGRNSLQAIGMGRKLLNQAGIGFGGETDAGLIQEFPAHTDGLKAIAAFLHEHQVNTVAMESTGIYWIALYELLESEGFEVLLVDPSYTHQLRGRPKTDRRDCQWIYRLHSVGLLAAPFGPTSRPASYGPTC